jgi:hypothetical protein
LLVRKRYLFREVPLIEALGCVEALFVFRGVLEIRVGVAVLIPVQ